jgi:hypothetical protein
VGTLCPEERLTGEHLASTDAQAPSFYWAAQARGIVRIPGRRLRPGPAFVILLALVAASASKASTLRVSVLCCVSPHVRDDEVIMRGQKECEKRNVCGYTIEIFESRLDGLLEMTHT